jgi:hypothetical protein
VEYSLCFLTVTLNKLCCCTRIHQWRRCSINSLRWYWFHIVQPYTIYKVYNKVMWNCQNYIVHCMLIESVLLKLTYIFNFFSIILIFHFSGKPVMWLWISVLIATDTNLIMAVSLLLHLTNYAVVHGSTNEDAALLIAYVGIGSTFGGL